VQVGGDFHDPAGHMPLWNGCKTCLNGPAADLSNISMKPFAGAIVAALLL
jgi:leucyl aminopeptidase